MAQNLMDGGMDLRRAAWLDRHKAGNLWRTTRVGVDQEAGLKERAGPEDGHEDNQTGGAPQEDGRGIGLESGGEMKASPLRRPTPRLKHKEGSWHQKIKPQVGVSCWRLESRA